MTTAARKLSLVSLTALAILMPQAGLASDTMLQGHAARTSAHTSTSKSYLAQHPKVRSAAVGAGVGTAAGALTGLISGKGVMRGAALGAGTGAGIGLISS